jgi:uncharacterized protein (TIGR00369 family)
MSKISLEAFNQLIQSELPWAAENEMELTAIAEGTAQMRMPYQQNSTRPGGSIAGPHMMMLADACMFAVVLSQFGKVELAVTTSFNINFLRKPTECDLMAEGKMIKAGKRLAVMEVSIFSNTEMVAHATGTYSVPPRS